jgi:hypothetical protein
MEKIATAICPICFHVADIYKHMGSYQFSCKNCAIHGTPMPDDTGEKLSAIHQVNPRSWIRLTEKLIVCEEKKCNTRVFDMSHYMETLLTQAVQESSIEQKNWYLEQLAEIWHLELPVHINGTKPEVLPEECTLYRRFNKAHSSS